jgi:hypothetical protein
MMFSSIERVDVIQKRTFQQQEGGEDMKRIIRFLALMTSLVFVSKQGISVRRNQSHACWRA